ncbi:MAG: lysophospholipase [Deltaproteobacteria bacterium]|nr:lysophospholipase [Deltaproteobacteria bacterium]
MKHHEQTIEAADGTALHVERWEPEGTPRFAVVFVHGGAEHVGRYARMAEGFGAHGGLCLGLDHRGQGKSGGPKGDVHAFEDYARDLRTVIETVAQTRPAGERPDAMPWLLFGHSMGGLISLIYLLDHAKAIPLAGAVISSPLIEAWVSTFKRWSAEVGSRLVPWLTQPTGIPPETISRDPEEVKRYANDPRRVGVLSGRWYGAMKRAVARVRAEGGSIDVPALWYVGTGDQIVNYEPTVALFKSFPEAEQRGQSLHCFTDYYHELHNEPEALRQPVIEMVEQWVLERVEESC